MTCLPLVRPVITCLCLTCLVLVPLWVVRLLVRCLCLVCLPVLCLVPVPLLVITCLCLVLFDILPPQVLISVVVLPLVTLVIPFIEVGRAMTMTPCRDPLSLLAQVVLKDRLAMKRILPIPLCITSLDPIWPWCAPVIRVVARLLPLLAVQSAINRHTRLVLTVGWPLPTVVSNCLSLRLPLSYGEKNTLPLVINWKWEVAEFAPLRVESDNFTMVRKIANNTCPTIATPDKARHHGPTKKYTGDARGYSRLTSW